MRSTNVRGRGAEGGRKRTEGKREGEDVVGRRVVEDEGGSDRVAEARVWHSERCCLPVQHARARSQLSVESAERRRSEHRASQESTECVAPRVLRLPAACACVSARVRW